MKLIPIETRNIPPDNKVGRHGAELPRRIYEAALIAFMDGNHEAVRIEEPRITKNGCYHAFYTAIEKMKCPVKVIMRDGNVYLVKTI